MALNRNGRVIFIDAPGTHDAIFGPNRTVYITYARVVSGAAALASLELFGAQTAVAASKILHLETPTPGAAQKLVDDAYFSEDMNVPDSSNGLTAVLTGTGSIAFIYIA